MAAQNGRDTGRFSSKGMGNSYQGQSSGGGMGALRGVRTSRPRPRPRPSSRFPTATTASRHPGRNNDAVVSKNDENDVDETDAIELTPSGENFRNRVLASVGLDDDDDNDIEDMYQTMRKSLDETTETHRWDKKTSGRRWNDYDVESSDRGTEDDANFIEAHDELQLLDDDYDDDEFSFQRSNQSESSGSASVKRIIGKLFWLMVAIAAIVYTFHGDDVPEELEIDEDVAKEGPYSYNGYKDARIPDDDIAQYGGGLFGAEVFDGEDDSKIEDETDEAVQSQQDGYHEHTGIVQIDSLWEQLNGLAETAEPFDAQHDLPVFWHIPKCGGTTLQDLMMHCIGMVGANEIGAAYVKDTGPLEVIQVKNGNRYINVDMSNPSGITHAKEMGLSQSGLANVVMTSWIDQTALVFDEGLKGRCFTMMRHPIRRAVSMFYYLKDATWEHTYSEVYKNMTIEEYAAGQYAEDNWMVRFLTNEMSGGVYERHLDLAKQVLESKCLVGLMEEFSPSFKRFNEYFGWSKTEFGGPVKMENRGTCVERVIGNPDNAHSHPTYEEGGEVWKMLMRKNQYDMILYDHAVHLFHDVQQELVRRT